ncbi:MAG TPA: hypothetical protein VN697_13200, partial [Tepidiformaceae bacterium]|nr:hypothetical protein [Tepidiformaceae bacterium]
AEPTLPLPSPSPAAVTPTSASDSPLAACTPGDVVARASAQGATGSTAITVVLSAASPCHFDGSVAVIVEDQNGNPQRITGNGVVAPISADLPGSVVFSWSNWCAAQAPFKADIRVGGQTVLAPITPPRCDDPTGPSKLMLEPAS